MKTLLTLALLALAAPAFAQTSVPATPADAVAPAADAAAAPKPATVRVTVTTAEGPIVLELEKERAPVTTANFLRYVDQKRFDGAVFYRAMKLTPDGAYGLIQGGTRGNPKTTLPAIKHEPTSTTGLSHVDGTISMARGAPGSATGDFFITIGELTSLDADLAKPGDNLGFAAFGRVVEGMEVVKKIMVAPTSPTEGVGVMKGQMIAAPIRISSARRTPAP
jgi:peptidyl-prolyl cis-trans isomerase A (cyclophilin A)